MSSEFTAYLPLEGRQDTQLFSAATAAEVSAACESAGAAFGVLRSIAPTQRAALLRDIGARIGALGDALLEVAHRETGLPLNRLTIERDRTVKQCQVFAQTIEQGSWVEAVIDRGDAGRQGTPKPDIRRMLRPLGPVAVFSASNFPLAYSVGGGDTASALAAACPVIVKGHSAHPGTGQMVGRAITEAIAAAGLPEGCFALLMSGGERDIQVGLELVAHPAIKAVGFTGSVGGGMALVRAGIDRPEPIPVFAEMGSVNPVFVLPGAIATQGDEIAKRIGLAKSTFAGQMCTCPGLVFVIAGVEADRFIQRMAGAMVTAGAMPMLTQRTGRNWLARIEESLRCGAREALAQSAAPSGSRDDREFCDAGHLVRSRLLRVDLANFRAQPGLAEESFGPSSLVIECASVEEMIDAARNYLPGCLGASLWMESGEESVGTAILDALTQRAGRVVVNGVTTGVEVCDAMVHSGVYPACSRPETTAVGTFAIRRWCRPVAFQNVPDTMLPPELKEGNPLQIRRRVDGVDSDHFQRQVRSS